jgi:hypothetical protein
LAPALDCAIGRANNRIKRLNLSGNDGPPIAIQLPDQMAPFNIKLPESKKTIRIIRLTIREVYPWNLKIKTQA